MNNFATYIKNNVQYFDAVRISFHSDHAAKMWDRANPFFSVTHDCEFEGATLYINDISQVKIWSIMASGWIYKTYGLTYTKNDDSTRDYADDREITI